MKLIPVILFSFIISFVIQKTLLSILLKKEIKIRSDVRKYLKEPRPRFGGIGIFSGFLGSIVIIYSQSSLNLPVKFTFPEISHFNIYLISLFTIFLVGLFDDLIGLNAWQKLPAEIVVASLLFMNGFSIKVLSLPFSNGKIVLPFVISYIITILWVVGITNAMNLIDGIDGLAGGIALIASISFAFISHFNNRPEFTLLAASMIGPILAFLIYNFYPSKIYMGDSGSLTLGFFLATISLKASAKASFGISFLVPIIVLFIPILDTSLSFLRRVLQGVNPFRPDLEHIHHRLIENGNDEKKVFYIIISWTAVFSIIGVLSALIPKNLRIILVVFIMIFGISLVFYLKYIRLDYFGKLLKLKKGKNKKQEKN